MELKAGLEIHQQLDTNKLFCSCPSLLRNDECLFKVKRNLNPVVGESGNIDIAAKYEKLKDNDFIYEVYDTNCLVELDEEPPHAINPEALKIVLQIAVLLNCKIFPVTQVMRKTVIDGSNTSGFQRSVLIAYDGYIETSQGQVGIETIALEEDAARIISREDNKVTYRLDRLGIPLIEITTKPDLKNTEQIKEAALKIGEIIRACKVKRGIGTIRQDLNISIKGTNRVEIKGFQDPRIMIKTVEMEVERQQNLVKIHEKLKKLKKFESEILDVSDLFKNTECKIIQNALKNGRVYSAKLDGFSGFLGIELCEGKRFGSELSDYGKIYGVGGLIHSDEDLKKYNLSDLEIENLRKKLNMKKDDAFIVVADKNEKAFNAINAAVSRALMQFEVSVVKEVRKSNDDGTTSFLRPMPGADRMYPETDLELLKISRDNINKIKKNLPKLKEELKGYLKEHGLNDELIRLILDEDKLEDFKALIKVIDNANLVAKALTMYPKEISVKTGIPLEKVDEILGNDIIEIVLEQVGEKISEGDVKEVFSKIVSGEKVEDALKKEKIDLSSEIKSLLKEKPGLSANAYMGLVMAKFKGKVSGKEVMDELKKLGL